MQNRKYECPCCGYLTLNEEPPGTYEICPVCYWEDDPVQFNDRIYTGGANRECLQSSRMFYFWFGASSLDYINLVREPLDSEKKWEKVKQLPRWVKKELGWYCTFNQDKPCQKHGLFYNQHPKYLKGGWYEYRRVEFKDTHDIYDSVVRRRLPKSALSRLKNGENLIPRILAFIRGEEFNDWIDTHGEIPEWVILKLNREQNDLPTFFQLPSNTIIKGRYTIYKVEITSRTSYGNTFKKRRLKNVPIPLQYLY